MKHLRNLSFLSLIGCLGIGQGIGSVSCPYGLVDDAYPGKCSRYVDDDENGICDLSEDDVGTAVACALSLSSSPESSGTIDISPVKDEYQSGESVVLNAKAADGYAFSGWGGDVSGSENNVTVTLSESFQVIANFEQATGSGNEGNNSETPTTPEPVDVMPIVYPEAAGSVNASMDLGALNTGDILVLTATASGSETFVKWDGDIQSTENPVEIELSRDLFVIAVFDDGETEVDSSTLVLASVWPAESGVVSSIIDLQTVTLNSDVELTASPNPGYVFKSWIGDISSTQNPLTITVDQATQVIAEFEANSIPIFQAVDVGDGWFESSWYGRIKTEYLPFFYHENAGWQYCVSEDTNGIYLYDYALGLMLWTNRDVYPYLYINGENPGWIWYFTDSKTPERWFYDFRSDSLKKESEVN